MKFGVEGGVYILKFAHVSVAHKTLLRPPNCCVRELEGWGWFNYRFGPSWTTFTVGYLVWLKYM